MKTHQSSDDPFDPLYDLKDFYEKKDGTKLVEVLKTELTKSKFDIKKLEMIEEIIPLGDEFSNRLQWLRAKNSFSEFLSEEENLTEADFESENRISAIQRVSKLLFLSSATTEDNSNRAMVKFEKCFELISSIWNQEDLLIYLFRSVLNHCESSFVLEVFPKMALWSSIHNQLSDDDVTLVCEKLTDKNMKIKFLLETGHTELANEMLQISRPIVQSEASDGADGTVDKTDQSNEGKIELNDEMFSILARVPNHLRYHRAISHDFSHVNVQDVISNPNISSEN